ncbi:hypothetical protein [Citricoccus muralis]|uniref:LppA-like lipoprotein n=1 Tax=Citricoccus muralis TaxID=169134 RepID=A0ABY8H6N1_9MICC|nr:hypothetical protein [Citricoccus muralis]WFP16302.1 hypothetical protein P8192_13105 [Citricoccus muralis]
MSLPRSRRRRPLHSGGALLVLGLTALVLAGCSIGSSPNEAEELAQLTPQQARDGSVELLEQIQARVPAEAIDDAEPLPRPGEIERSLITCEDLLGSDVSSSSTEERGVTYPAGASLRLTDDADGEALAEGLLDALEQDEGWAASERTVTVNGEEQASRSLTTDDGYLITIRARSDRDGDPLLNVNAWSPCFALGEEYSIHEKY